VTNNRRISEKPDRLAPEIQPLRRRTHRVVSEVLIFDGDVADPLAASDLQAALPD
jgi:hypothetical protein